MDYLNSLSNITLSTPSLEVFKGIENGKITAVFNSDAQPTKPLVFGRTITERFTGVFSTSAYEKLEEKYQNQTALTERRAAILTGTDNDTGEVEDKMLKMLKQHSVDQENKEKQFIKVKSLSKQIQNDIRIHLSNEIKQATTPDRLQELHKKIQRLDSSSETDEQSLPKVDKKIIKSLQKVIDRQCDRVARQLESHLKTADMSKVSADVAVDTKCRCLMEWSDTIKKISPDTFKSHQKPLDQLLSKTLISGLGAVKPHPDNLGKTKQTLLIIENLSKEVSPRLEKSLGKKSTLYKNTSEAIEPCLDHLRTDLKKIPNLIRRYSRDLKNIETMKLDEKNQVKTKENAEKSKEVEEKKRGSLKTQKRSGFFGRYKIFRLFDRDYQNKVGAIKKTTKDLSQKIAETDTTLDNLKYKLQQTKSNRDQLSESIEKMIAKYGQSIQQLDEFSSLNITDNASISVESLRSAIKSTVTTGKSRQSDPQKETKRPKRPAPSPPTLTDYSISESSPEQQITPASHPEDVDVEAIRKTLNSFSSDNPSVSEDDEKWIIERANFTLGDESINYESLSEFFDYFNTSLNKQFNQDDSITYHDRDPLINGFQEGLACLESGQSFLQAKAALDNALSAVQMPDAYTDQNPEGWSSSTPDEQPEPVMAENIEPESSPSIKPKQIEAESPEQAKHASLFSGVLSAIEKSSASPVPLKKVTTNASQKIPRQPVPLPPRIEASNPIAEAILDKLSEFTDKNDDYVSDSFDDTDSAFGDQPITVPDKNKEQAITGIATLMAARTPFYSMSDEEIIKAAAGICDLKDITEEGISELIDDIKSR